MPHFSFHEQIKPIVTRLTLTRACEKEGKPMRQIQVRSALLPTLTPRVKSHSIENAEENRRKNEEKQCRSKVYKLSKALHFRNGITIECRKCMG